LVPVKDPKNPEGYVPQKAIIVLEHAHNHPVAPDFKATYSGKLKVDDLIKQHDGFLTVNKLRTGKSNQQNYIIYSSLICLAL
jgi:hypothetical protein